MADPGQQASVTGVPGRQATGYQPDLYPLHALLPDDRFRHAADRTQTAGEGACQHRVCAGVADTEQRYTCRPEGVCRKAGTVAGTLDIADRRSTESARTGHGP